MKLLLVGATGLVGSHVLALALNDARISKIVVLTRNVIEAHPKVEMIVTDFDDLVQTATNWDVDSVICTLGTTMSKAKNKTQFRLVDYNYPLAIAKMANHNGILSFVLNSSMGADPSSHYFYMKVKGDIEQAIRKLNYNSLTIIRPGLIEGDRNEQRLGEQIMMSLLKLFGGLLPTRLQLNPVQKIAAKMLEAALQQKQGVEIICSEQLT